jgi:energy-coupling factor transporter ATP-binding protein EcfA2
MNQLENLLQHCTVKLTLPGRRGWGTGFFVAPEWILTCAHVVQEAKEQLVQVWWQNQENWAEAIVERSLPNPYDLALLRVTLPTDANPPCVYLDEEIRSRDPLFLFGYPDQDFPNGCPVTVNCEGFTGDEPALIKFALGQVRPGMSGSPLLNQRTGRVCGVVKFTRDRSSDLGGGAIPTRVILEQFPELRELQRVFHEGDRRWSDLVVKPSAIDFQPYLKAIVRLYSQQSHLYTPTDALLSLEARSVEQQDTQQPEQERKVEQFPVLTGLRKYALGEKREHVLLAGRPGSGKSTALRQLAVALAKEGQVPVLVQLKGDRSVLEAIASELEKGDLYDLEPKEIKRLLRQQRFVLLLDGVNEIPNDYLRRGLAQFREDNPTVPMIFTTRELAVGGDLGIGKRLEMKPLSEPQMRDFVKKYLSEQGEQLLTQLRDRLREIAETPLFLKMLCDVFKQTREIPQNKGELFQQFDRNYERLKKDYVPVSKNFWEFKSEVLQHLAFSMIQADGQKPTDLWLTISRKRAESLLENWLNQRGVVDAPTRAKEWLKDLCNHHLLQDAAKPGEIEFHHQLFQEYYAAEYLLQILPSLSNEQLKRDYLNYLKWTEAIALMLSLLKQEDQALRTVKLALDVDRRLGAKLAGKINPVFQQQAIDLISTLTVSEWFRVELLGTTQSELIIPFLLQVMESENLDIAQSAVTWLTNIGGQIATHHLRQKLGDLNNLFREQRSFSLPDPKTDVWIQIIKSLSILSPADAILELHKKVLNPRFLTIFSSSEPEILLVKLDSASLIPTLFEVIDSQDCSNSKRRAVDLLGRIDDKSVTNKLVQALGYETDSFVREGIIDALGNHSTKESTVALVENLGDQDFKIREKVIKSLVKQNSSIAIEELRKILQHPNWEVSWDAAITL